MIDFELPSDLVDLRDRVDSFIKDKIVPLENDPRQTPHGPTEDLRRELVSLGRAAGLLSPHAPKEYGGLGLDHRGMAVIFEAAGWSTFGPLALNIQAPDEGNVNLLNVVGTPEQKAWLLPPLVRGEIRTVFTMTETATAASMARKEAGSLSALWRGHKRAVILIMLFTSGGSLYFYTFTTYMQKLLVLAGIAPPTASQIMTAALLGFVVLQPLMGALCDRIGLKTHMLIFTGLATITTDLTGNSGCEAVVSSAIRPPRHHPTKWTGLPPASSDTFLIDAGTIS